MAHSSLSAPHFVATKSAEEIAIRLRDDEALIDAGKPCSWVAWYLTGYDTEKGSSIADHLAPKLPALSHDIKSVIYENLLSKIRRHLKDECKTGRQVERLEERLNPPEVSIALKVLTHLIETSNIQPDTPAETIIAYFKSKLAPTTTATPSFNANIIADLKMKLAVETAAVAERSLKNRSDVFANPAISPKVPKPPPIPRKRCCYICRLAIIQPHPSYPSMCMPCGSFNTSSSRLSIPPNLFFPPTFTALVTGARINLGYHTVLRLLRCGARVIATTRYPRDAVARYLEETDSAEWRDRLRVVGADFRCAADAFALVSETKRCLEDWSSDGEVKLHLLINNAAQTLTDSVKKEELAVRREELSYKENKYGAMLIEGVYNARVRGKVVPMQLEDTKIGALLHEPLEGLQENIEPQQPVEAYHTPNGSELEPYAKSSWVQSLFEIPYEDVISAHAVNTFVPLILCRELLPLMGSSTPSAPTSIPGAPETERTRPQAYIINVSSREGIFEDRTDSTAKQGTHVHTNMSKAALNMITETEAATAWKTRQVAMNTVDPGYMSAAPEYEDVFGGVRPIGWEDGAGRVLWPVAVGEKGQAVWGRFLKHYGAVKVDPGAGRG